MELKIIVFDFDNQGKRKELFRRVLKVDSFENIPFSKILDSFRFFYKDKFVEFSTLL